jgi:hypothetical protein
MWEELDVMHVGIGAWSLQATGTELSSTSDVLHCALHASKLRQVAARLIWVHQRCS